MSHPRYNVRNSFLKHLKDSTLAALLMSLLLLLLLLFMFIFNRHFNQLAYAFDKDFALSSGCNHVAGDIQSLKQVSVRHIKYIVLIVSELFHPSYFTYVFVYAFLKLSFVKTLAPVSTSTSCLIFRQKSSSSSTRNPCHIMAFTM